MRLVSVAFTDLASDARVLRAGKAAAEAGADVTFLVPSSDTNPSVDIPGARVHAVSVRHERGNTSIAGQLRFMRAVRQFVRDNAAPDIVHVHNMPDYLIWALKGWRASQVRMVLDVHDMMSELATHKFAGFSGTLAAWVLRSIEGFCWASVDHVITVHELYADRIRERTGGNVGVSAVLNACDSQLFNQGRRLSPPDGYFKMVFHGTVTQRSGILSVVKAMPLVLERVSDARLFIFGSGQASNAVKQVVAELGLDEAVYFRDEYIPLPEIVGLIADAHIGLATPEISKFTEAMLPVKLVEYINMGIPAVATGLPMVRHHLGDDCCVLLERPTSRAIADAVIALARDVVKRQTLGLRTGAVAESISWSRYRPVLLDALGIERVSR